MKKLAILSAIALSGLIFNTADAQVRVGLNIGPVRVVYTQHPVNVQEPVYQESAPVYDDSNDDDYYYLPDVDAYYDVTAGCYYYNDGYNWISAAYLPGSYRNYDWRTARRYEIHEHRPFIHNDIYRSRYNGREVAEWKNHSNQNRGNDNHYGNKPEQNRGNDNHYGNRGNAGYGQPSNQNHGQGGYGQPNQNRGGNDRGHGQPSNQNHGDSNSQARGGNDHIARNSQNMGMSHRMAKF